MVCFLFLFFRPRRVSTMTTKSRGHCYYCHRHRARLISNSHQHSTMHTKTTQLFSVARLTLLLIFATDKLFPAPPKKEEEDEKNEDETAMRITESCGCLCLWPWFAERLHEIHTGFTNRKFIFNALSAMTVICG